MDLLVAGLGGPFGHRYLGARNSKRHVNLAGSGFIENVAHLIMKCGEFARLRDGNVITQTVELLRTAVLRIKQFKGQRFDKGFAFRAFSYGMRIHALIAVPGACKRRQRAEIGEGIGVRRILGINIFRVLHGVPSFL